MNARYGPPVAGRKRARWPLLPTRMSASRSNPPSVVPWTSRATRRQQSRSPSAFGCAEQQHPVHSSIFLKGGGSEQFGLELIADGSIEGSVGKVGVGDRRSPASKITNKWQLVSLNYDPDHGNLALYVNGVQVAQNPNASRTLPRSEWPLAIGDREFRVKIASYLPPMAGQIDEVAVFRRAFSAEQVKEMYEAEKPD